VLIVACDRIKKTGLDNGGHGFKVEKSKENMKEGSESATASILKNTRYIPTTLP